MLSFPFIHILPIYEDFIKLTPCHRSFDLCKPQVFSSKGNFKRGRGAAKHLVMGGAASTTKSGLAQTVSSDKAEKPCS